MEILSFLWTYGVPFLVILSVLVFVHEMGHYAVARRNGVRVEVFSIGFGRELFGWTDNSGTRWKFGAVPLGGYVKMFGDANAASAGGEGLDEMSAADRAVSFHHKTVGQRAAIVFAGPAINYIFAVLVLTGLFVFSGQPFTPPKVGMIAGGSPAAQAGLRPGDRFVMVDGKSIERFEQVMQIIRLKPEEPLAMTIERDGRMLPVTVTPLRKIRIDRWDNKHEVGVIGVRPFSPAKIVHVRPKSAAAAAGFRPADEIVEVSGKPIKSFEELASYVRARPGETMAVTVLRDGRRTTLSATPERIVAIGRIKHESHAHAAGFRPGDRVVALNGQPLVKRAQLAEVLEARPQGPLVFTVKRGKRRVELKTVTPKAVAELQAGALQIYGQLGISRRTQDYMRHGVAKAGWQAVKETVSMTEMTATAIGQMIAGTRSARDIGGPLRIGEMAGQMAELGLREFLWFMGILSLHLCLINLLPIPMLDGGHLVFYAYEAVRGKPLSERAQEYGFRIGLALVLTLMVVVTFFDIDRLLEKVGIF